MPFRHQLSKDAIKKKVCFSHGTASRKQICQVLEDDLGRFSDKEYDNLGAFLKSNGITNFFGNVQQFTEKLKARDSIDFAMLLYLGKDPNVLKSHSDSPDMSNLIFFSRANHFIEGIKKVTQKDASLTLVVENGYFDANINDITGTIYRHYLFGSDRILNQTKQLAKDFRLNNIKFSSLDDFMDYPGFKPAYERYVRKFSKKKAQFKKKKDSIFLTFFYSFPTGPRMAQAVRLFTESRSKNAIEEWAAQAEIKYLAWKDARSKTDFWGNYGNYIHTTVSQQKNAVCFNYPVGRMPPIQGSCVIDNGKATTEYLYDIMLDSIKRERDPEVCIYNKLPFYTLTD